MYVFVRSLLRITTNSNTERKTVKDAINVNSQWSLSKLFYFSAVNSSYFVIDFFPETDCEISAFQSNPIGRWIPHRTDKLAVPCVDWLLQNAQYEQYIDRLFDNQSLPAFTVHFISKWCKNACLLPKICIAGGKRKLTNIWEGKNAQWNYLLLCNKQKKFHLWNDKEYRERTRHQQTTKILMREQVETRSKSVWCSELSIAFDDLVYSDKGLPVN